MNIHLQPLTAAITLDSLPAGSSLWITNAKDEMVAAYTKQADGLWFPFTRSAEFDTLGMYPREAEPDNPHRPLLAWEVVAAAQNASASIEQVR